MAGRGEGKALCVFEWQCKGEAQNCKEVQWQCTEWKRCDQNGIGNAREWQGRALSGEAKEQHRKAGIGKAMAWKRFDGRSNGRAKQGIEGRRNGVDELSDGIARTRSEVQRRSG